MEPGTQEGAGPDQGGGDGQALIDGLIQRGIERGRRETQVVLNELLTILGSPAKCKDCKAEILWCKTKFGKNIPLDTDGRPHHSTCPNASEFRYRTAGKARKVNLGMNQEYRWP